MLLISHTRYSSMSGSRVCIERNLEGAFACGGFQVMDFGLRAAHCDLYFQRSSCGNVMIIRKIINTSFKL